MFSKKSGCSVSSYHELTFRETYITFGYGQDMVTEFQNSKDSGGKQ